MIKPERIELRCEHPIQAEKDFVLYWMIAQRRSSYNFALDYAVEKANQLNKPLIVLEPLRLGYQWVSTRHHQFIIDGMKDNQEAFAQSNILYYPFVETPEHSGKGLLKTLASKACLVVSDLYPTFFIPKMINAAEHMLNNEGIAFHLIDGNGIFPLQSSERIYTTAASFRRFLQKNIADHLSDWPSATTPVQQAPKYVLNQNITEQYPPSDVKNLDVNTLGIPKMPSAIVGGSKRAQALWARFSVGKISKYHTHRNEVDTAHTSELSPYLHYGHISSHQMVQDLFKLNHWTVGMEARKSNGSREGWWNLPPHIESFLDQIITWRELGFVFCYHEPNYDQYETLPDWAKITMNDHILDPRPHIYTLEQFEEGKTHDPIWNAAQMQLVRTGMMHNYLRMLWGKKVLHWSKTPQDALEILIHLNNKYALDGRDPNSYSGIFWCFGRFDRAWTERDVFGKIRYMSSESTKRKLSLKNYLHQYDPSQRIQSLF